FFLLCYVALLVLHSFPTRRSSDLLLGIFAGAGAIAFGLLIYAYLTLPDVRPLIKNNPTTTAFIRLRADEARENGLQLKKMQRWRSEEHTSELQSPYDLVCRLLLEK